MDELKNLLVGIDFSPRSLAAAQMAIAIAEPIGATVELVHVVETQLSDYDIMVLGKSKTEIIDILINEARITLDNFASQLNYNKLQQNVLLGSAAVELTNYSENRHFDLLVVGDTGSGSAVSLRGVGVTTYRLVEYGPRNVLVVKAGYWGKIKSIVAAISFVPVADDVMHRAYHLARLTGAELHVVRVIPDITELRYSLAFLQSDIERMLSDSIQFNKRRLEEFIEQYKIQDVVLKTVVLSGKPGPVLVDYLQREKIDVVVLGTGTSYRIAGYLIGSTTHRVLNQTLSNVFVVRSLEPPP